MMRTFVRDTPDGEATGRERTTTTSRRTTVAFSRRALAAGVPHALNPAGFEPCLIVCPNSGPCAVV
jgi:hypothetical protein